MTGTKPTTRPCQCWSSCIPVEEVSVPAEALETHEGSPLTADDLIDLMVDLECDSSCCSNS